MKTLVCALFAASTMILSVAPAFAVDMNGTWLRPKTGKHVKSFKCKGGLGLKVVHSGAVIMCGAKHVGDGKFEGTLKSTEDGNTYSGSARIAGKTLILSGCVFGGLICKDETWKRVK